MELLIDTVPSPIGEVIIVSDGTALRAVDFEGCEQRMHRLLKRQYGDVVLRRERNPGGASDVINRYFAGDLEAADGNLSVLNFQQENQLC